MEKDLRDAYKALTLMRQDLLLTKQQKRQLEMTVHRQQQQIEELESQLEFQQQQQTLASEAEMEAEAAAQAAFQAHDSKYFQQLKALEEACCMQKEEFDTKMALMNAEFEQKQALGLAKNVLLINEVENLRMSNDSLKAQLGELTNESGASKGINSLNAPSQNEMESVQQEVDDPWDGSRSTVSHSSSDTRSNTSHVSHPSHHSSLQQQIETDAEAEAEEEPDAEEFALTENAEWMVREKLELLAKMFDLRMQLQQESDQKKLVQQQLENAEHQLAMCTKRFERDHETLVNKLAACQQQLEICHMEQEHNAHLLQRVHQQKLAMESELKQALRQDHLVVEEASDASHSPSSTSQQQLSDQLDQMRHCLEAQQLAFETRLQKAREKQLKESQQCKSLVTKLAAIQTAFDAEQAKFLETQKECEALRGRVDEMIKQLEEQQQQQPKQRQLGVEPETTQQDDHDTDLPHPAQEACGQADRQHTKQYELAQFQRMTSCLQKQNVVFQKRLEEEHALQQRQVLEKHLTCELEAMHKQIHDEHEQRVHAEEECDELRKQLEALANEQMEWNQAREQMEMELYQLKQVDQLVKKQIAQFDQDRKKARAEVHELQEQVRDCHEEKTRLLVEISGLQARNEQLITLAAQSEQGKSLVEQELHELNEKYKNSTQELLHQTHQDAEKQIEQAKQQHARDIAIEKQKLLSDMQAKEQALAHQLAKEREKFTSELAEFEEEIYELRRIRLVQQQELESCRAHEARWTHESEQLQRELQREQERREEEESESATLREEVETMANDLMECDFAKQQVNDLENTVALGTRRLASLENQLMAFQDILPTNQKPSWGTDSDSAQLFDSILQQLERDETSPFANNKQLWRRFDHELVCLSSFVGNTLMPLCSDMSQLLSLAREDPKSLEKLLCVDTGGYDVKSRDSLVQLWTCLMARLHQIECIVSKTRDLDHNSIDTMVTRLDQTGSLTWELRELKSLMTRGLAEWTEQEIDAPVPPFALTSNETNFILQNWTAVARSKKLQVKQWLVRAANAYAEGDQEDESVQAQWLDLTQLSSEVKDAFLMLLLPLVKQNVNIRLRVFTRRNPSATGRRPLDSATPWEMKLVMERARRPLRRPAHERMTLTRPSPTSFELLQQRLYQLQQQQQASSSTSKQM